MLKKIGLSILVSVLLVTGCAPLGPNYKGVEVEVPATWENTSKHSHTQMTQWWKIFNDPTLNALVQTTYAQNLDLKSAGLRIVQARAALGISEGLVYPQLQTLTGNAVRTRQNARTFSATGLNFDLGWEMDIWGKYARGIESSEATVFASVASYHDIMVSVVAEVARNYINYRTYQERIAYAKRNIHIQERVTRITEIQFNSGNVSELDMQQARTQLYATRATLPALELAMVQSRNALAVLMGTHPDKAEGMLHLKKSSIDSMGKYISSKKSFVQLKDGDKDTVNITLVPTAKFNPYHKVDAQLLSQRPDIKLAEFQARANSANIGSTLATLYPSFSLFGNIGINSNNATGSWVSAGDAIGVTIGPSFSWNIFQYGRIKNQVRVQDAVFEESLVNYNNKVLSAIAEVSNAIHGYRLTKIQQEENKKAVDATVRAFNISMTQYNDGLVSYQRLLSTVESLTRNQDQYAQIKGNLATNVILLYKALGGGWQMSKGKAYLSREMAEKMQKRTDWGEYLDENMTRLPKGFSHAQ